MNNDLQESSQKLLACFFSECERNFRFLEQKHSYSYLSGLSTFQRGRQIISPYQNQTVDGIFQAVTRYEKDNVSLEILFGDRELILESYIYYNGFYRMSLGEILSAARKNDPGLERRSMVAHSGLLASYLETIATALKKNRRVALEPGQKLIDRALTMRGKRLEQNIREQHKKDIQKTSIEAARAFLAKDFTRVIELFTPYENYLNIADLKKLNLARKNIISPF